MSINNLCFRAEIRKLFLMYTPVNPFCCIKVRFKGVKSRQPCFYDGPVITTSEYGRIYQRTAETRMRL